MDVLLLSRLQFAFTIMFHYIFPPLSIGLGWLMVLMEGQYLCTKDPKYSLMTRFWTKIFAVNFALGVATGIVMEFEFGTNWATYSRYVGDVFGSALAAEGLFAFFLESGFLAVLVFGWDRVSAKMHFFSTLMVALGSSFSAVWIVIANSWQQTPAGYHLVQGPNGIRAEIIDFWGMVFNPSSMHRLLHVLLGSLILGAFFVMSISAFYLLRKRHEDFSKKSFDLALIVGTLSALAILVSGHSQADMVSKEQPAKLAAFEGHFKTGQQGDGATLYFFGWPDAEAQEVKAGIGIPGGLSFLLHGDFSTPVTGLDKIPKEDHPPVWIPFMSYHVMVALGFFFIGITLLACFFRWKGTLYTQRWLLWVFVFAVLGAYIANQTGWIAAETGRQPFIVYPELNIPKDINAPGAMITPDPAYPGLRTSDGLSKSVAAEQVLASIVLFGLIYALLFAVWVFVLNSKIQHGPDDQLPDPDKDPEGHVAKEGA